AWVKDYVEQYGSSNCTSSGCDLLKRKSTEYTESPKEKEPQRKVPESTLGHDKINYILAEAQSKEKGKEYH
ncbi:hypothetical protein HAX54_009980, partial [Datura stramonium]|nr:hypothetical protein [Datura stramonium]